MMKTMKRLGAMLLALVLTLALAAPAFAAEEPKPTGSITMENKTTSEFTAYQIVTWDQAEDFSYTNMKINETYRAALIDALGFTETDKTVDRDILMVLKDMASSEEGITTDFTAKDVTTVASKLAVAAKNDTAGITAKSGVISDLPYGYYLVLETKNADTATVASRPILVSVPDNKGVANIDVTVKTSKPTVEKKIVEDENTFDAAQKKIGDTVDFQLTATVPDYAADATNVKYYINDTLSKGLTPADPFKVTVTTADNKTLVLDTDYKVFTTPNTEDGTTLIQINFNYATIRGMGPLTITYSATLNENAVVGDTGNPNTVTLTYTNNPTIGGENDWKPTEPETPDPKDPNENTTPEDHVIVYTIGIEISKVTEDNSPLAGAEFTIYSDSDCTKPVGGWTYEVTYDENGKVTGTTPKKVGENGTIVTDAQGNAYFTGLIAGEYYIKETKAPDGYDLLTTIAHVTITFAPPAEVSDITAKADWTAKLGEDSMHWNTENTHFLYTAVNTKGFQLPGTGGMGTTLFTVAGVSLIVVAGALLLIYNKKNRA